MTLLLLVTVAKKNTSFVARSAGFLAPVPHSSAVRGADRLRELRLRAGRSAWRGFYRRLGDVFVIAAIGLQAQVDKRGFARTGAAAQARLDVLEEGLA